MSVTTIITIVLSLYFLIYGLITLIKGDFAQGDYSKYTEKSVKTYARVMGASFTLSGLLFIPYWVIGFMNGDMKKITMPQLILIGIILVVLIICLILRFVILKKRSDTTE